MRAIRIAIFGYAFMLIAWLGKVSIAQLQAPTLWIDAASPQTQEDGTPAAPFKTIAKALAKAEQNSLVRVKSGEYRENIVLTNGITLKGEGNSSTGEGRPVLLAADPKKPVTTMRGQAGLEGTKGVIQKCRLLNNKDDGLDFDGDTDCKAIENEIRDNQDDGIEIRLQRKTLARIEGNIITGNGEDGIEIINTTEKEAMANRVEIIKNTIRENARYGIGGVDEETEEVKDGLVLAGIILEGNIVEKNRKAEIVGFALP
jgi:hypothetical protein